MTELLEAIAALEDIAAGDMSRESMIARANEVLGNVDPDDDSTEEVAL